MWKSHNHTHTIVIVNEREKKATHVELAFQLWFICYAIKWRSYRVFLSNSHHIEEREKKHCRETLLYLKTLQNWRMEEPAANQFILLEKKELKTHRSRRIRISNANNLFVHESNYINWTLCRWHTSILLSWFVSLPSSYTC